MAKKKTAPDVSSVSAHRIWLAGLGALAAAEEEGEKLFRDLVARGERFDAKVRTPVTSARGKVRETIASVRERAGETVERIETAFDDRVQDVLQRLGVPSRSEIASLASRVERLTKAVEGAAGKAPAARKTATKAAARKVPAKKKVAKKTAVRKTAARKTKA